ncbi:MAG TPA: glycine betaine ABC transporter substrate-binding protein [Gemmatimonadota bacterium]|nr:glycine betaine ABC transporter substrate-binding protein [Gemmatimonadota bacterium]
MRGATLLPGITVALFAACGGEDPVVVASKNFTEQDILGEIVAQELEARGVPVERRFHLGGTFVCHNALVDGEADIYVEYTGTAYTAILERPPISDPDSVLLAVESEYAERWDLAWGPPLGFENTFALVVRSADAESLALRTISDLARVADGFTAGFGPEFMAREDGYGGLREEYGFEFGEVRQMELGLMYRALDEGQIDVAVANSTDGQIAGLGLVVLLDDRRYFPPYQAAPVVRREVLEGVPAAWEAIQALEGVLDDAAMRELNRRVAVEGEDAAAVVRAWRETRPPARDIAFSKTANRSGTSH